MAYLAISLNFKSNLGGLKPTLLSESFEVLRAAAANGATACVLPTLVARRQQDLLEITPPGLGRDSGRYRIYVLSQTNCDR